MVSITSSSRKAYDGGVDVEMTADATDKKTDEPLAKEGPFNGDGENDQLANWKEWLKSPRVLSPSYKLVTDKNYRQNSMMALRFAILTSSISTKMLAPNYAIMCSGSDPESFPTIAPFGFNSATYFIPMMSLLGVAISSIFIGPVSDKIGRKGPILWMAIISAVGNIVKYFTKNTFWGFCISNLVFGFFLGNLPIGMAYIGDIYTNKIEKEKQLGILVGHFVLGNAGGGMIAILMNSSGLFAPLWVGTALMIVSCFTIVRFFIEPGDARLINDDEHGGLQDVDEFTRPETINNKVMWNIILGALADNFGSTALFPMCLSPLALEQYNFSFTNAGEDPILTITGYQWLSVCVALLVIPSTMITPHVFARIGASGCCVFGNVFTGLLTMALVLIAGYGEATQLAFGFFVFLMYGGFPFTVFSQLTTGPMLDVIAPEDKLGYVQGLNNAAMNFGMAIAPWLFGVLADETSTNISIWIGVGISFLAGAINAPLVFRPEMGPPPKPLPYEEWILKDEAAQLVEEQLSDEHVPPALLFSINRERSFAHKPFILPRVKPFAEDKDKLDELRANALDNYRFRHALQDQTLAELTAPNGRFSAEELCDLLNTAIVDGDPEAVAKSTADVGQWIGDYMQANGYFPHMNSLLIKQMVMSTFPSINTEGKVTPENIEETLIQSRYILGKYRDHEEKKYGKYNLFQGVLGKGQRPQFFT